MIRTLKLIGVISIIAIIATLGVQYVISHKATTKNPSNSVLGASNRVLIGGSLPVKPVNGVIVIKPTRTPVKVTIKGTEEVYVERPWLLVCLLPELGLETGRSVGIRLGIQILRSETLEMGVSLGLGLDELLLPNTLDISLDKDLRTWFPVFQNTLIGVGIGIDKDGYSRVLGHLSLYL